MFASLSLGLVLLPFVSAAVYDVQVGAGGNLAYSPEAISAQPGDQVVFHFNPKNHTVTQSSFASPCGPKDGGIDSGFHPVAANETTLPTFTITINDTQPVWMYCAQAANTAGSHCGKGMVFAVNCGQDGAPNSFTNFKNSALAIGASLAAAASSASSTVATPSPTWTTAAYGDYTIPPAPDATPVTQAITLGTETWTTTYSSYPNSPAPTPAALDGQVHTIIVGGVGNLTFTPSRISAQPRDIVVFEFHQKNHTVTQSSFADPCRKLSANGTTGFDSGFMPVADNATTFPTWNFTVTDTAPVWAYCRQQVPSSHCGAGMVFAINSDESSPRNFTAFQNVAKTLNGTAVAATVPSATPSTTSASGGSSLSINKVMLSILGAVVVAISL